jgi:hypothetical protein
LGLLLSGAMLLSRRRVWAMLSFGAMLVLGFILVKSDNRASVLALVGAICCALGSRFTRPKVFSALLVAFLILTVCVAVLPGRCADLLMTAALDFSRESDYRVLNMPHYLRDITNRLNEWEAIVTTRLEGMPHWLFGIEWESAAERLRILGHPHNIWLWMFVMGGMPAVIGFGAVMFHLLSRLYKAWWDGASGQRMHASIALLAFCPLLLAALTNSIAPGTEVVWGIIVAIAVATIEPPRRSYAAAYPTDNERPGPIVRSRPLCDPQSGHDEDPSN